MRGCARSSLRHIVARRSHRPTPPSVRRYMIASGATTLWEAWTGDATHQISSRNHIMFGGGVNRFLMRAVGGLWVDEAPGASSSTTTSSSSSSSAGWQSVHVGPTADALRSFARSSVSHRSPFGVHSVSWAVGSSNKAASDEDVCASYSLNATVPVGVTATVSLPLPEPLARESELAGAARLVVRDGFGAAIANFTCGDDDDDATHATTIAAMRVSSASCSFVLPGVAATGAQEAVVLLDGLRGSSAVLVLEVQQLRC